MNVVEALQPPTILRGLWLLSISTIPKWMNTLSNLRELLLYDQQTIDWSHLMKLPSLEKLSIRYMRILEKIDHDFLGMEMRQISTEDPIIPIFPRLKELKFSSLRKCKVWEDITEEEEINNDISIFPCLQILKIHHCSEFKVLPHRLLRKAAHVKFLRIKDCRYLQRFYNKNDGENWKEISHISNVQIVE